MRVTIIALILAIAALGLGSFATFTALDNDGATPVAESGWSETECEGARQTLDVTDGNPGILLSACVRDDNCDPYLDMLLAINDNCE